MHQPSGFRRVVRDVADLCELQFELLAVDGKIAVQRSATAAVTLLIGAIFGLSAVVAIVLALASFLHEQAEWTISSSLLAAAAIAAVLGGMLAIIGSVILKKAMSALDETRSEFAENLRWIKAAVVAPDASPQSKVSETSFRTRSVAGSAMNGNSSETR